MSTCGASESPPRGRQALELSAPWAGPQHPREMPVKSLVHAQSETVALHRPYLYRYALSKLRRTDTADEVVQETLMAALEGKATFRGDSALRTWLTGILKHKIVDWQRREARNPLRTGATRNVDMEIDYEDTTDALFDSGGGLGTPPPAWPNPEQSFENPPFPRTT